MKHKLHVKLKHLSQRHFSNILVGVTQKKIVVSRTPSLTDDGVQLFCLRSAIEIPPLNPLHHRLRQQLHHLRIVANLGEELRTVVIV